MKCNFFSKIVVFLKIYKYVYALKIKLKIVNLEFSMDMKKFILGPIYGFEGIQQLILLCQFDNKMDKRSKIAWDGENQFDCIGYMEKDYIKFYV